MSATLQMRPNVTFAMALTLALGLHAASAQAAVPVYADSFVSAVNSTPFGSGVVVGAPDKGGMFLGDSFDPPTQLGTLTVKFSNGLIDGAGNDLFVVDIFNTASEVVNLSVSADNINYTFVGQVNSVVNQLDIAGAYTGTFYYVKIANASTSVSMDVDTVGGFNAAPVPEPGTVALLATGLAVMGLVQRRRTKRCA